MDGFKVTAFCTVCSAEGDKLLEDCSDNFVDNPTRMAMHLGLSPDVPSSWPMKIIHRLIDLEKKEGEARLFEEIRKLNGVSS